MKKVLLAITILVDVALIGVAGFVLYMQVAGSKPAPASVGQTPPARTLPISSAPASAPVPGQSLLSTGTVTLAAQPPDGTRHFLFTYKNAKARSVAIRADFTGWKSDPMKRDATGTWTYQASLLPGEYAYCFAVDDKIIRDPANPRKKQIGRTFVSAIVVKPAPAKPG
jgi:hypothetical protein